MPFPQSLPPDQQMRLSMLVQQRKRELAALGLPMNAEWVVAGLRALRGGARECLRTSLRARGQGVCGRA